MTDHIIRAGFLPSTAGDFFRAFQGWWKSHVSIQPVDWSQLEWFVFAKDSISYSALLHATASDGAWQEVPRITDVRERNIWAVCQNHPSTHLFLWGGRYRNKPGYIGIIWNKPIIRIPFLTQPFGGKTWSGAKMTSKVLSKKEINMELKDRLVLILRLTVIYFGF